MSRRRLRVVCSSDEENDEPRPPLPPPPPPLEPPQQNLYDDIEDIVIDDIETDFQTVTINSSNPTPSSNYSTTRRNEVPGAEPIPIDISVEDGENVVINGATNDSSFDSGSSGHFPVSESPVNVVLENLGLRLKKEWLDSCLHGLQSSVMGFQRMDNLAKAKLCFEQFLRSDMNYCGAGVLPRDVHTLHLVDLKGPFVLQVDEIVNISRPIRGRYQSSGPGSKRCLKLSMTDGVQRVFGMEYRPINDIQVLGSAGLKVAISNVNIRHGLLMLVPEVLAVLGGTVEELEAARQRLVTEINKPPRGKRKRSGVAPPLATRATLAAWPPHNNDVPGEVDRNSSLNIRPQQASAQGPGAHFSAREIPTQANEPPEARNHHRPNLSSAQEKNEVLRHTDVPTPSGLSGQGTTFSMPRNARPSEDFGVPMWSNPGPDSLRKVQPVEHVTISNNANEASTEVMEPSRESRQVTPLSNSASYTSGEHVNASGSRHNDEPDVDEMRILDESEQRIMLSINNDIPFTYLASLSAKCAALEDETSFVRGRIKCFLTAVKGFQYRQATFELRVFIDDGSLITEILVDHSAIQKEIGCTPQEVISAIDSSDIEQVIAMKENLKRFQNFLANFEGMLVVEMNKASAIPVAIEMNQGCSASDACLLLRRLQSTTPLTKRASHSITVIELSP